MLGFLKKSIEQNTRAAVCEDDRGVAVARVKSEKDIPPVLEQCVFFARDESRSQSRALEKIREDLGLDRLNCVSMMEPGSYNLLMVEAPDVQPDELRAAIRWKIKDLIDFHIDDAVVDVFEVPDTKSAGINKMMYAVVARASTVKGRIDRLVDAGFNLSVIDIPELALRNIASLLPEDVAGVAMVYIGEDRGLITITKQSTLFLSRRIENGLSALPDTAMHSRDPELIKSWLDGIVVEIQRSLDYYERHFSKPQVSSIIITPLNKPVDGVAEYISQQLEIPARILDVNSLIDVQDTIDPSTYADCILAIGAALRKENTAL